MGWDYSTLPGQDHYEPPRKKLKPKPRPPDMACPLCGETIAPYQDGDRWVFSGFGAVMLAGYPYHQECLGQSKLWKRVKAMENKLEEYINDRSSDHR